MGVLLDKSGKSHDAALSLLSSGQYCNSIQCSYFSCLQLAKDVILSKAKDADLIERELKDSNASHVTIIKMASEAINSGRREKEVLLDIMPRLKRWRKNAVYDDTTFEEEEASEALRNCESVNRILQKR